MERPEVSAHVIILLVIILGAVLMLGIMYIRDRKLCQTKRIKRAVLYADQSGEPD